MAKYRLTEKDAKRHDTDALKGWYYQLPDVDGGRSVIYAEVTGDHGQRVAGDKPRIYFILDGEGEFIIKGKVMSAKKGDVIVIPPRAVHSYKATKSVLKLVLVMDLIDLNKLPPRKK